MKKKLEASEEVNESTGEIKQTTANLKFEVQAEDLEKWNFQTHPLFFGQYKRTEHLKFDEVQPDKTLKEKEFDLYVFEEFETQQRYHIDSCHSIQKYFESEKSQNVNFEKVVYAIQFHGKKMVKDRTLNTFSVSKASLS
jgi:hypothetical protein